MVRSACGVLILCLLAARASAHGGALHPGGPEQNNFIRAKVASCKNWVPATGTIKAGKVVPSAAKLAPITVKVRTSQPCWDRKQTSMDFSTQSVGVTDCSNSSSSPSSHASPAAAVAAAVQRGQSCSPSASRSFIFQPPKTLVLQGPVTLWQYLYKNCSTDGGPPVAGAAFDVTITRNGKPLSGVPLDGVGMTGECPAPDKCPPTPVHSDRAVAACVNSQAASQMPARRGTDTCARPCHAAAARLPPPSLTHMSYACLYLACHRHTQAAAPPMAGRPSTLTQRRRPWTTRATSCGSPTALQRQTARWWATAPTTASLGPWRSRARGTPSSPWCWWT